LRATHNRVARRVKRTSGHQSSTSSAIPPSQTAAEARCSQSLRMLGIRGSAEPAWPDAAMPPSASTAAPAAPRGARSRTKAAATSSTTAATRPKPGTLENR
jgi:hypothetical protein